MIWKCTVAQLNVPQMFPGPSVVSTMSWAPFIVKNVQLCFTCPPSQAKAQPTAPLAHTHTNPVSLSHALAFSLSLSISIFLWPPPLSTPSSNQPEVSMPLSWQQQVRQTIRDSPKCCETCCESYVVFLKTSFRPPLPVQIRFLTARKGLRPVLRKYSCSKSFPDRPASWLPEQLQTVVFGFMLLYYGGWLDGYVTQWWVAP